MSFLDKFLDTIRLNDDYDDDDDFFDDDVDEEVLDDKEEKKSGSLFSKFKKHEDDDLDLDALDDLDDPFDKKSKGSKKSSFSEPEVKQVKPIKTHSRPTSSKVTPMRKRTSSSTMEVCVIKPTDMEDTREIADTLIANCTVLLNVEGIDVELAQRIIDFSSGACYSIGGGLQKISSYIFILTPENVEVSGDIQEILSGAFDITSVRSNY